MYETMGLLLWSVRYKRIENRSPIGQEKHSDWLILRQKSVDNLEGSVLPLTLKPLQLSRLRYLLLGNPDVGRSFLVTRGSGPCTRHWKGRNPLAAAEHLAATSSQAYAL